MNVLSRYAAWFAALAALLYVGYCALPARQPAGEPDLQAFGAIPVVEGGRVKPLDTVARTNLTVITGGRQTFRDVPYGEPGGHDLSAMRWLMEVWSNAAPFDGPAAGRQFIRIENDQLLNLLDLKFRPEFYRYSPDEIKPHYLQLRKEFNRVREIDAKSRDPYEQKTYEAGQRLSMYESLVRRQAPLVVPPASDGKDWQSLDEVDMRVLGSDAEQLRDELAQGLQDQLKKAGIDLNRVPQERLAELGVLFERELTKRLRAAAEPRRAAASPAAAALAEILRLYKAGDAAAFNQAVADYQQRYAAALPASDLRGVRFEAFFNRVDPFHQCLILYVVAFMLASLAWTGLAGGAVGRMAFGLAAATAAIHLLALIGRMYIQGRPPVTNLYSSAVFVGLGSVVLALGLELLYRNGVGTALAGLTGFLSLLIADNLGASGDTLEMMQAVLDTQFWLATHVTVVNLGYVATFVAGFLGINFILRGLFTRSVTPTVGKELSQMTYGVLCFATLLSFTGTVLGGLWADWSWGRFWGWDPKENGALMVVIWNALALHARWAGMVKQRGLAVLAVLGNIVVTWSWFGTNQLGAGLHAYGFRNDIAMWVVISSVTFLGLAGLGMLPMKIWRSSSPAGGRAQARAQKAPKESARTEATV